MIVILDTNIIVSALLRKGSIPFQVLLAFKESKFSLVLSHEIYNEYEEVLRRDKFRNIYHAEISSILAFIRRKGVLVKPSKIVNLIEKDTSDNIGKWWGHMTHMKEERRKGGGFP